LLRGRLLQTFPSPDSKFNRFCTKQVTGLSAHWVARVRVSSIAVLFATLPALAISQTPLHAGAAGKASPRIGVGIPVVENYTTKDYNGFGQVWTIAQDKQGLMYFGVSGGTVLQFDGVSWRKVFLSSNVVRSLAVDANDRVWVGSNGTFGYLEPDATGTSQYVSLLDRIPQGDRGFTDVWQTLPTPQGVFFRTFEHLFRWDGSRMQVWTPAPNSRFHALSMVRGRVYTDQEGIGLQEIVGDEIRNVPGGDGYKNSIKLFLHPYDDTRMVVSERNGLLSLYDGQKVTPFRTAADDYLKKSKLYTSTMLRDGSLCVTTLQGGVVIVNHDGSVRRVIDKPEGLLSSDALSTFEDREGALWIGSDNGMSRVMTEGTFSIYGNTFVEDVNLYQGSIYATTVSGNSAVARVVFDAQTHRPSLQALRGASQGWVLVDFKDPSGRAPEQLLVSTSEGVMRVNGDQMVPVIPALHGLQEQGYFIGQSHTDPMRIYVGHSDGVSSIRWNNGRWVDEGRLPGVVFEARNIVEDGHGNIWASGGANKVLRIHMATTGMRDSKAEILSTESGLPPGSMDAEIIDGSVYVTVERVKHIFRWDEGSRRFVIDDRFLLPMDGPISSSTLQPDGKDRVWSQTVFSGNRRIGLFLRGADGVWHLDENSYRPLTQLGTFVFYTQPDGGIWITGEKLVHFVPPAAGASGPAFPTVVRQVAQGKKTLFGGSGLDGSLLRLQPGTNSLSFSFASLSFSNPKATTYQYKLDGADKDWSEWSNRTDANYSGLGPGKYTFRVRSRAFDGRDGQEGAFAFVIAPPWYRTAIAYVAYVILWILLSLALWRLVIRHERNKARRKTEALESQARALEATVNERTKEIREQAAEISAQKESIELLSEIGREITASLDLNTILFKLYERVNQITDATIFGVGLYRPEKQAIDYTLAIESGKRYAPYSRSTTDKNQLAVWCIDHRQPILINDVASESPKYIVEYSHGMRALEDGSVAQPPESMIYLPLIAQDRVLGVLSVQSFRRNAYTEQHLRLLNSLASYTTIALDNANAYLVIAEQERAVRERAAELLTINHITNALATQLDRDQLIQFVGNQVRDLFKAPIAYVAMLERSTMMLHFPYAYGEDAPSRPFGTGLTSQILRTGEPLLINENMDRNRARLGVEQIGRQSASYLGVPIPSGGEMVGVISVQSTEQEGRFTEADQRLLSTIASAVGVAFHNARLFEEARAARAAAEEADSAKSAFLSTVSHELRTPLTSVLGFAKIIRRRLLERLFPMIAESDPRVAQSKRQVLENLDVVVSEGERLTKLIDDVLDLAKIEAGKFTWNMASVSVKEVIERAVAATSSLIEAKRLRVESSIDSSLPEITGDHDRLIQVVINLISNAVKFTSGGAIRCSAHCRENEILVSVKDSGIGIAPADQPKVFEKFKQVGDTLTDKPKGTGLGLPICKEIIEHHGGRIWVESALGEGSTFFFTLPITDQAQQLELLPGRRSIDIEALVRRLRDTVTSQQTQHKSVLVVDDDPNIRTLLQQELTEAGYSVRLAEDGRKALALIREEIPGLVILDVMMPEMNGFDVAAVLKNDPATMHVPIIILSILEDRERGFRLGVDRYLTKPIDTGSLFQEMDTLLGQGKSRKKVMVVDEDASMVSTLTQVLQTRGFQVTESNGPDFIARAVDSKPDIIILNSLLSNHEAVRTLRFEKGMENVLFLIYQ
jgi:signal transduction histidine kinase/CheY-like chemotaxis protein